MSVKNCIGVGAVCVALLVAPGLLFADFYDNFDDGTHEEDPNVWDIDDPCWIIFEPFGNPYLATAQNGWLRLWSTTTLFPMVGLFAYTDTGDSDPNTSETWWGVQDSQYIVARTLNVNPPPDPNDHGGESVLLLHADALHWYAFAFEYPYFKYGGGKVLPRISSIQGVEGGVFDWVGIYPGDPRWVDETGGFWILLQYESDGNPDMADPNGKYLRAAWWNGNKFDWDGEWMLQADLGDPCSWHEPDLILAGGDAWWCPEGVTAVGGLEFRGIQYVQDAAFDQIEARTGVFTNVSHTLDLTIKNGHMGTVTIDPDLLDDPNNASSDPNVPTDPNELRRYTDGTEVVLVAEALEGKSFKSWKIYDPNHPGDGAYAVQDTNAILYLTMDADWEIEAAFKCGSSAALLPLALVALGLTAWVRRRARGGF